MNRRASLFALALLAACSEDPAAPTGCDAPRGCEVAGFDLEIVSATLLDDHAYSSEVGALVVPPGEEVRLRYVLVNRGTERSAPALLVVRQAEVLDGDTAWIEIPALDPGEYHRAVRSITTPDVRFWPSMLIDLELRLSAPADTSWYEDADDGNDYLYHPGYHLRVPILEIAVSNVPDTIRALERYIVTAEVTNRSPFVALHDSVYFSLCAWDYNDGVEFCPAPGGEYRTATSIGAGQTRVFAADFVMPHDGIQPRTDPDDAAVGGCLTASPDEIGWSSRTCVSQFVSILVLPNVPAACGAPVLVPPAVFDPDGEDALCEGDLFFEPTWVHVFEAEEGQGFEFMPELPGEGGGILIEIHDLDGNLVREFDVSTTRIFRAPHTGRFVLYSSVTTATQSGVRFRLLAE